MYSGSGGGGGSLDEETSSLGGGGRVSTLTLTSSSLLRLLTVDGSDLNVLPSGRETSSWDPQAIRTLFLGLYFGVLGEELVEDEVEEGVSIGPSWA